MAPFVFRAAAALDLRRRQEETAVRGRAAAAAALDRAERAVAAEAALASQFEAAAATQDPARREWYRNWIDRQRLEIARGRAMAADRRTALRAAVDRANAAHRDVRVLERLRDRLWKAWQLAAQRAEQRELDWLGTVRYTMAARQAPDDGEDRR